MAQQSTTCFIALVDDHALLRHGLANLINEFGGYKVLFEADNGKDFIAQLKGPHHPDIVLLDITMPEMNGYETAEWIQNNLPETKVLVLSMLDNDTAIIRMLKRGARGFILKDSKPSVVKQALDQIRNDDYFINDLVSNKLFRYVLLKKDGKENEMDFTSSFTERELEFFKHACTEMSHKEIAELMNVSPRTIDSYRDAVFEKTGVNSRVGLILFAIKNGLLVN